MPDTVDPTLEETAVYEPEITSGVFSYSTHAAVVSVDPETGEIRIENYAVAEDCGTVVNPMIVDGQIYGGVAQGVGTALYEEIPYDEYGQPQASTFADYHWPGPTSVPSLKISHIVTPATGTEYGMKGMGEGAPSRHPLPSQMQCGTPCCRPVLMPRSQKRQCHLAGYLRQYKKRAPRYLNE